MTKRNIVLKEILAWSEKGVGVSRQTLSGSLSMPINSVSGRVTELLDAGVIKEKGSVRHEGRSRALLWAA